MAKHFKIDARAILTLGRESIKDHTTAVVELVKNSYDAGAKVVDVEIRATNPDPGKWFVRVADDGDGMSAEEVEANWLRIGFSEKRTKKTIRGRRKVGEKGIGRLSADRLGANLQLRSQSNGEESVGLSVDWDRFDQPGRDLQQIAIDDLEDTSFLVPQPWAMDDDGNETQVAGLPNSVERTGTELVIRNLRQVWVEAELEELREELSILTPPFEAVEDFQVRIITDAQAGAIVPSAFMETWEVSGSFRCDSNGTITYTILERDKRGKEKEVDDGKAKWNELVHRKPAAGNSAKKHDNATSDADDQPTFGPLEVRLMFFPRSSIALRSSAFSLTDLRNFLERNSGVRIYRDRVRVKPYGSPDNPDGDWLGLGGRKLRDPAGAARRTFKFAPNQVVGAVFLTRDSNPAIADSASREGLVHGRAFTELTDLVMSCLRLLETAYHQIYTKRLEEAPAPENPREKVKSLGEDLRSLALNLRDVKGAIPPKAGRTVEKSLDHLQTTVERIQKTQKSIEELANREIVYRGLATLGIAATTFGHETQRSLQDAVMATNAAKVLLKAREVDINRTTREIDKAIKNSNAVAAWGAFALTRVRRDRRRRRSQPITPLIEKVIEGMRPSLEGSDVTVRTNLKSIQGSVFGMDIESVVINLLTNAYDFCKQKQRMRVISVSLQECTYDSRRGMELAVADTGPGVATKLAHRIWEPMFSTKKGEDGDQWGTGLGLSIIDAIVRDMGGTKSVDRDPELGGARFKIWLPLE